MQAYLLQTKYNNYSRWYYVKTFYFILLGDFGDYKESLMTSSLDNDLFFIILFLITIIIVIVMLNLIIAIISDTFEKAEKLSKIDLLFDVIFKLIWTKCKNEVNVFQIFNII